MLSDFRIAWRVLCKERSFLLAVLVLALGIGGVATQYSVVNGMLLRPPAFPHAERLMSVSLINTVRNRAVGGAATADYLDWCAAQQSFEELACYGARLSINVTYQDTPRRYGGVYVTHNFLATLGVKPLLGRDFTAADDQPGAAKVIIISHQVWQNDFGGMPGIIGQAVYVNGRSGTVVGVMPPGFSFPLNEQLWTPLFAEFPPRTRDDPGLWRRAARPAQARRVDRPGGRRVFRLRPAHCRRVSPDPRQPHRGAGGAVWESYLGTQLRQMLYLMLGAVAVVLLIACVNVMNMQLARAARRTRDLAVCSALGASRWRLLRQMLIESLALAATGAVARTLFALWATDALLRQTRTLATPPPSWVTFDLDWGVLGVTVGVTVGAALLSGLIPAWLASRSSPLDLIREGGRTGSGRRVNLVIRGLVILQIALTTALLVVSTFLVRSIVNQQRINWGYDTSTVLIARMTLFEADHPTLPALGQFYDQTLRALRADPHFSEVALTTRFRLAISQNGSYEVESAPPLEGRAPPVAALEGISDGYFAALGMRIIDGRDFTPADTLDRSPVALVNAAFARRHFGGESPVGRRVRLGPGANAGPWLTIVGVAPDTRMQGPYDGQSDGAGIFLPLAQAPQRWITIVVRGRGGAPATWAGSAAPGHGGRRPQPADLPDRPRGAADRRDARAEPAARHDVHRLRPGRHDPRLGRPLRRDVVLRQPAHAGIRHPHGPRR